MLTMIQFKSEVRANRAFFSGEFSRYGLNDYDEHVAWGMYTSAASASFLIFGRTNIGRAAALPANAINAEELMNLGSTNNDLGSIGYAERAQNPHFNPGADAIGVRGGGAILHYQGSSWRELYNVTWLLGGVHGRRDFHAVSPRTRAMVNDASGRPTVWGKEMAVLDVCGYQPRSTAMEEIWTPTRGTSAITLMKLVGMWRDVDAVGKADKFIDRRLSP
jgi:hypothetical protein